VFTSGTMAELMMVCGRIIKWRDMESLLGQMVVSMLETTWTTKKRDMEYLHGQMVVNMTANGVMENKMVKAFTQLQVVKPRGVNGKTAKELHGFEILLNESYVPLSPNCQ